MIRFLIKGLIRDRYRTFLPSVVVTIGVMLTVVMHCWVTGVMGDFVDFNAKFSTGHVKIVTRVYSENMEQPANDLALINVTALISDLRRNYPEMSWVKRIRFGGLLDVPDEKGETRAQGPAAGLAVDMLSMDSLEPERLNILRSIVNGRLAVRPGEILVSNEFAAKLGVGQSDDVTLLCSTMHGSMAMQNLTVAGTVYFGVSAMDRSAIIMDVADAQLALDMRDSAGEILGYFKDGKYDDERAEVMTKKFKKRYGSAKDEFAPVILRLTEQNDLAGLLDYAGAMTDIIVSVFVLAMSIVLWNAGLIAGMRRYGEVGVRLAIGEDKGHIYRSMLYESVLVGILGSALGTTIGLSIAYILQAKGFNIGSMMKNATMMMPTVLRASITAEAVYIGFFPGLLATVLGTALSGIGIYRRRTAQLFRELEA